MRIYVVQKADESNEVIGVYDKEGLKTFLKEWRKKGRWSNTYSGNKFWCRVKSWAIKERITSYPLNRPSAGMSVQWPFQK